MKARRLIFTLLLASSVAVVQLAAQQTNADQKPIEEVKEPIAASLKALELSPDDSVLIKGNLAHAYLFDNQFETAKAIYLENKDAKLDEERSFSHAVLDDFKELEEAGITHPDMEKIKALPHH